MGRRAPALLILLAALGVALTAAAPASAKRPPLPEQPPAFQPGHGPGNPSTNPLGSKHPDTPQQPTGSPPPTGSQQPTGTPTQMSKGAPDPLGGLQAKSPMCDGAHLKLWSSRACRFSGSLATSHPWVDYGLDRHSDNSVITTAVTSGGSMVPGIVQQVIAAVWFVLVLLVRGTLLLLDWGFSLDFVGTCGHGAAACQTMPALKRGLLDFHQHVFGSTWLTAAFAVAGLWGIWNGLVRRRVIDTMAGLAMTVVLVGCGLAIINKPDATIGNLSRVANQGALGMLSGVVSGSVDSPVNGLGEAERNVTDAILVRPWCALEFGDVNWCLTPNGKGYTPADVWLSAAPDSTARDALYAATSGKNTGSSGSFANNSLLVLANPAAGFTWMAGKWAWDHGLIGNDRKAREDAAKRLAASVQKEPQRVALQEDRGAFPRLALLFGIGIAMLGVICMLVWLGIRLIGSGLMLLALLLLTPVMLLVACLGERGRTVATQHLGSTCGACLYKLVVVAMLAMFLFGMNVVVQLHSLGEAAQTLAEIAWGWGCFKCRHRIHGFVTAQPSEARRSGIGQFGPIASIAAASMAWRGIKDFARDAHSPWRHAAEARERAGRQARQHAQDQRQQRQDARQRWQDQRTQDKDAQAVEDHRRGWGAHRQQTAQTMFAGELRETADAELREHAAAQIRAERQAEFLRARDLDADRIDHEVFVADQSVLPPNQRDDDELARRKMELAGNKAEFDQARRVVNQADEHGRMPEPTRRDVDNWIERTHGELASGDAEAKQRATDRLGDMETDRFNTLVARRQLPTKGPLTREQRAVLLEGTYEMGRDDPGRVRGISRRATRETDQRRGRLNSRV